MAGISIPRIANRRRDTRDPIEVQASSFKLFHVSLPDPHSRLEFLLALPQSSVFISNDFVILTMLCTFLRGCQLARRQWQDESQRIV